MSSSKDMEVIIFLVSKKEFVYFSSAIWFLCVGL